MKRTKSLPRGVAVVGAVGLVPRPDVRVEDACASGVEELDEGVKISARILGVDARSPETIRVGMRVEVEFIEAQEEGRAYLGFKPVEA